MLLFLNYKVFLHTNSKDKERRSRIIENSSKFSVSDYFLFPFKTTILCWLRVARKHALIYFINDSIILVCSEIRTLSQTKAVQPSNNRTLGCASEARARILQSFHPSSLFACLHIWKCMYAIVFVYLQISDRLFFHTAQKHSHSQKNLKPDCCYAVWQL